MSPPFCVWITPHIHYLNETAVCCVRLRQNRRQTTSCLASSCIHLVHHMSQLSYKDQRHGSTQYKCMHTCILTCRHAWEDPRLPPAIMHVKALISGQHLWCQNDESILRAYKNTKAAVQGQIYTGGYLRVPSGLTYSSDVSTKNTQRHE